MAQSARKKYAKAEEIPDEELPANFDWRNIEGYNFAGPVKDQKGCGSCYTVSFAGLLENRLQVKYGRAMPPLSSQQMMTCNYMNEGCEGGWSQFHSIFF